MDAYRVSKNVFSFAAANIDPPLRARKFKEQDSLSLPLSTVQRLEQDSLVLTMVGSLDCSGAMLTRLLEKVILEEGVLEGTCRLVGTLLEPEHSRGWAVSHLLSSAITMDCNLKLIHHNVLLLSMMLPCALATEAYQLLFDSSGACVFGEALLALLEKASEVATQKRCQSLEEVLVKSVKGAKHLK